MTIQETIIATDIAHADEAVLAVSIGISIGIAVLALCLFLVYCDRKSREQLLEFSTFQILSVFSVKMEPEPESHWTHSNWIQPEWILADDVVVLLDSRNGRVERTMYVINEN